MEEKTKEEKRACQCPYCDAEVEVISELSAVCNPCGIVVITCTSCGGYAREGLEKCPKCGEPLHR